MHTFFPTFLNFWAKLVMLVVFPDASIPQTANGTKKDTTTGNTSTSIYSPQTGDTTDLSGYVITLIASVTVITGWLILRKKKME